MLTGDTAESRLRFGYKQCDIMYSTKETGENIMQKMWDFFENLNEFVYASDIDTNELIYMNKKAREIYGVYSEKEYVGRKCYELLQGCNTPCSICNNQDLVPGQFKEWYYYSPILQKYLSLKDTMIEEDGRRCRIEIAIDVSMQENQRNVIQSYQNLETFANEGLRIALQAPTPDKGLDIVLEYIGKALKGERTYIFEQNETGGDDNTYEWVASGIRPEKENLQNLPAEVCANWYRNFREDKNIIIEDLEDIREEDPLQYENLKRQEIQSLVVVPLYDENKIIGFYGVDNPHVDSLDYAQNMLQIMGHFIISSLKRRNLLRELRTMSYLDQLTRLGNRFALEKFVENLNSEESIGVVYCDITGLKHVNDTEGHEAGDRLILRSGECLKKAFGAYGLFRVGGDELLALCPGIEEKVFEEYVVTMKKDMSQYSVNMALGTAWQKNVASDFERLLSESERRMYEDKAAYYRSVGKDRRQGR